MCRLMPSIKSWRYWRLFSAPCAAAMTFVTAATSCLNTQFDHWQRGPLLPSYTFRTQTSSSSEGLHLWRFCFSGCPILQSWSPGFSAIPISFLANIILRAVLKSASRMPMILRWCIFRTPGFFSNMTSTILFHCWCINPCKNGSNIMIAIHSPAMSSSQASTFQME